MKIQNLLPLLFSLSLFLESTAQVSGYISDNLTKKPVGFATIELDYGEGQRRYTLSDSSGNFSFDTASIKKIQISKIGYKTFLHVKVIPHPFPTEFQLVAEITTLENVEVRAIKPLITSNAQKIIFDVFRDSTLSGRNVAEAISRLPFVSMDALSNISYKDKRMFLVLVNGNRLGLLTEEPDVILKSIPASRIKTVELIFDPPLEYRMKGYEAVINIVTIPGFYKGWLLSLGLIASTINDHSGNLYVNSQYNETYFQIFYERRNESQSQSSRQEIDDQISNTLLSQENSLQVKSKVNRYGFSFDQRLKSNLRFGLYASYNYSPYSENGVGQIVEEKSGVILSFLQPSRLKGLRTQGELGTDFSYVYKKGSNLGVQLKYNRQNQNTVVEQLAPQNTKESLTQKPGEFSFLVSNSLSLKKNFNIENVAKFIARDYNNDFASDTLIGANWISLQRPAPEVFRFRILNLNNRLSYNKKNISARVGLNLDYAKYSSKIQSSSGGFTKLNFLPFSSFRYAFKNESFFDVGYFSSLFRPSFIHLVSSLPNYNPLIVRSGNPDLPSTIVHNLYSEYSVYSKNGKYSLFFRLNVQYSRSYLNAYYTFDSVISKQVRSYRQSEYVNSRISFGGEYQFTSSWSADLSTRVGFTRLGRSKCDRPIFFIDGSTVFSFSKSSGIQILGTFESKTITSYGFIRNFGTYDVNLYLFMVKRKLQLNFIASNFLLKKQVKREVFEGVDYYGYLNYYRPYRAFELSINVRLGELKTFKMNTRKLNHSDTMSAE